MINEKKRIDKLDNIVRILAGIDYDYWLKYAGDKHLQHNSGVQSILTRLVGRGLMSPEEREETEKGMSPTSMKNMENKAKKVSSAILKSEDLNDPKLDALYLKVLDLVNAWGGSSISRFYDTRINGTEIKKRDAANVGELYKKAVISISKGDIDKALDYFTKIKGIDMSFGTKHLWFWSEVFKDAGNEIERQPVYDDRISRVVMGANRAVRSDFGPAKELFTTIAKNIKATTGIDMDMKDIEVALFNFAGHYWPEGNFSDPANQMITGTTRDKNYKEAIALTKLRDGKIVDNNPKYFKRDKDSSEEEDGNSIGKRAQAKIDKEETARIKDKEDSLKKYPTDIDELSDDFLKLKGDDETYNFKDFQKELDKIEYEGKNPSYEFSKLRSALTSVDPRYLNKNWRSIRSAGENRPDQKGLDESWNKWSKWATN